MTSRKSIKEKTIDHYPILVRMKFIFMFFSYFYLIFVPCSWAYTVENQENYTYKLTQSNENYSIWTTLPSERVFKNDPVPDFLSDETSSRVLVYAAKNEFEPFQIVVKPSVGVSGNISINMESFGSGIETEIHQVKYINITKTTDILGKTGYYPDPLWPVENGSSISLNANENTAFWITVHVPKSV
nr:hypothetical protein [Desulfobulbaceae bacterium]